MVREPSSLVSIPHRYAKNFENRKDGTEDGKVSIPHRYAKNSAPFKK